MDEEIEEAFLKVIHAESESLITLIEVLSPANKVRGSRGRASFMSKRQEVMNTGVHWVEIDLLRAGAPSVTDPPLRPAADYRALVSRGDQRTRTRYWAISVRQPLPVIPVPLRGKEPEAPLDPAKCSGQGTTTQPTTCRWITASRRGRRWRATMRGGPGSCCAGAVRGRVDGLRVTSPARARKPAWHRPGQRGRMSATATPPASAGKDSQMPPDTPPPARVVTRDGRLVAFDPDRICQDLFAAGEAVGAADAFLARELGESTVHFLAREHEGETPTTAQVAECVVKVLRALGQPELARAFEGRAQAPPASPRPPLKSVLADAARRYTLEAVYSRDLAAATEAGLLQLTGLEAPDRLAGCVLGPPVVASGELMAELEAARRLAGRYVAIDGLDHRALAEGRPPAELARAVLAGLRLAGLEGVINLNAAAPPGAAVTLAEGPLFAAAPRRSAGERGEVAEALLTELLRGDGPARVEWHLAEADFAGPTRRRLEHVAQAAIEGAPVGFVFDRPRRPVALAEGVDRDHPAALLVAGLGLPALLEAQPGLLADAARFREKLGSLVRLALSAAVQKRAYLRQRQGEAVTSGFLLDRARFVVVPVGLDEVVRRFTGWGLANGGESLELGVAIMRRLREVLRADARARAAGMAACLDGPAAFALEGSAPAGRAAVAGLTPWDEGASPRSQLRAAGALHAGEGGQAALFLPAGSGAADLAGWLEQAWRQGDVARLRVVRG